LKLEHLNLENNMIEMIEGLPKNVKHINLSSNYIDKIENLD